MITTDDPAVMIDCRTYPLADKLIELHLCSNRQIMLHTADRLGRGHHYVRYRETSRDGGRWYIRTGKRGQVKRYLSACEITWIITNGKPETTLYQYRLDDSDTPACQCVEPGCPVCDCDGDA